MSVWISFLTTLKFPYVIFLLIMLQLFPFDPRSIDWPRYMENYCLGAKQFILKENISELPKARLALQRSVTECCLHTKLDVCLGLSDFVCIVSLFRRAKC